VTLAMFGGLGALMIWFGARILQDGQLTYKRNGQGPITVSPDSDPFSYYYQVAFFGTFGGTLLLMGVAMCMFAFAKVLRTLRLGERLASNCYTWATRIAWLSLGVGAAWLILRMLRSALIA
jgi:hypothetical protein